MQEEIENRTINLVITTSKLSVRVLMDGLRKGHMGSRQSSSL